jgi:hypothetical protein
MISKLFFCQIMHAHMLKKKTFHFSDHVTFFCLNYKEALRLCPVKIL